jgi:hypothetical protein
MCAIVLAFVAIQCLFAGTAESAPFACGGDDVIPTAAGMDQAVTALVCDINQLRAGQGLGPLRWDSRLATVAQGLTEDMARSQNLSHIDSEGRDLGARVAAAGYLIGDGTALENIAAGDGLLSSPRSIAAVWMQSPEHREKLLDPHVTDIAVGAAADGAGMTYYAADFGVPGSHAMHSRSDTSKAKRLRQSCVSWRAVAGIRARPRPRVRARRGTARSGRR